MKTKDSHSICKQGEHLRTRLSLFLREDGEAGNMATHTPARVTELGQGSVVPQNQSISHFLLLHERPHGLSEATIHEAPLEEGYRVREPDKALPLPAAEDHGRGRGTEDLDVPHVASLELGAEVADVGGQEKALICDSE